MAGYTRDQARKRFLALHIFLLILIGTGIFFYNIRWGVVFTLWSLGTALGDDLQDTFTFKPDSWLTRSLRKRGIPLEMQSGYEVKRDPFRNWMDRVTITFGDAWHVAKFSKHTLWLAAIGVALQVTVWQGIGVILLGHISFGLTHEIFFGRLFAGKSQDIKEEE